MRESPEARDALSGLPASSATPSMPHALPAADRPAFVVGEKCAPIRLTVVMLNEDGDWKIQHGHFSAGVPDEVAFENAGEWSTSTPAH